MVNHVMLDNISHKDLKINISHGSEFGENNRISKIIPAEFRQALIEYPLFITKDKNSGEFLCVAILGFDEGENLFLEEDKWNALYVPLDMQRQPFLIGYKQDDINKEQPLVFVDTDHPRANSTDGESVFLAHGGNSEFLQQRTSMLLELINGDKHSKIFIKKLQELDLIEPIRLEIKFVDGEFRNFEGLYTIHEEKLREITGEQAAELHKMGFLELAHFFLASSDNVSKLIVKKNKRISALNEDGS